MKKVKGLRSSTLQQYERINGQFPNKFPIFGNLCRLHRITPTSDEYEDHDDKNDPDFIELPFNVSKESGETSYFKENLTSFLTNAAENVSTIKYQINKTAVNDLSDTSIKYHKRKFNEVVEAFQISYAKRVAPGQEEAFLSKCLSEEQTDKNCVEVPEELRLLLDKNIN